MEGERSIHSKSAIKSMHQAKQRGLVPNYPRACLPQARPGQAGAAPAYFLCAL
jgi:hypothetical protein